MTPERLNRIQTVLKLRQPDLTVITDEVHKQRNLAAIIRTCDAVGVDTIHCVVPSEGYQIYSGTSASAEKWVEIQHSAAVAEAISPLKASGFQIVAASLSPKAKDYRNIDYTLPTALLLGAEVKGVSQEAMELCDHQVILPMLGMVESLNVSVACALILAQAQTQRQAAGMYASQRLTRELYNKRFMHWAHPVIAQFCDKNQIAYPPIREDGEILDLSSWYENARKQI